ncbi:MAG: hypothetical protein ACK4R8_08900 [Thiobacillus sp.]
MRPSPVSSLLVAALVLLRQPCARNKASARMLLDRAAECDSLSHAEREACRNLADELEVDETQPSPARLALSPSLTDWGEVRRRRLAALRPEPGSRGIAA